MQQYLSIRDNYKKKPKYKMASDNSSERGINFRIIIFEERTCHWEVKKQHE